MKGVELPINVLVIVAVALIVLLALIALMFGGFNPFTTATSLESVKGDACRELVQQWSCSAYTYQAPIDNFDADRDGLLGIDDTGTGWTWATPPTPQPCGGDVNANGDNLAALCACFYNIETEGACRALCGCTGY